MLTRFLGAALLGISLAAVLNVSEPRQPSPRRYCPVVGFSDYEYGLGRSVYLRPKPGCQGPSLVRKVSLIGGAIYRPFEVQAVTPNGFPQNVWLFLSALDYSLDGETWQRLRLNR